jgi:uncharacterized protein YrzB (UPF0473 family)
MSSDLGFGFPFAGETPRRFPDADRILLLEENGDETLFVLLSSLELHGRDYAMLAREDELEENTEEDMAIYLFELTTGDDGEPQLVSIDDDDTYAEVFALFSEIWDEEDELDGFVSVGEA